MHTVLEDHWLYVHDPVCNRSSGGPAGLDEPLGDDKDGPRHTRQPSSPAHGNGRRHHIEHVGGGSPR
jgi:hypothetical protein